LPSVLPKKECGSELGEKRKTISFLLKGPNKFDYVPVKKSKLLQKFILGIKLVFSTSEAPPFASF